MQQLMSLQKEKINSYQNALINSIGKEQFTSPIKALLTLYRGKEQPQRERNFIESINTPIFSDHF